MNLDCLHSVYIVTLCPLENVVSYSYCGILQAKMSRVQSKNYEKSWAKIDKMNKYFQEPHNSDKER